MEKNTLISATIDSLAKEFGIETEESLIRQDDLVQLHTLRTLLAARVDELLQSNFEKLRHFLYRIDIPEKEVARLYAETNRSDLHFKLADVIIDREMQKVKTRALYEKNRNQRTDSGNKGDTPS
jgi:hypothetical protein